MMPKYVTLDTQLRQAEPRIKIRWFRNPEVSHWPGKIPGRVVLCSRCYQAAAAAVRKGRCPKVPQREAPLPHVKQDQAFCPAPVSTVHDCKKYKLTVDSGSGNMIGITITLTKNAMEIFQSEQQVEMPSDAAHSNFEASKLCSVPHN